MPAAGLEDVGSDEEDAVEELPASIENAEAEDEMEDVRVRVAMDKHGQIVDCNQVHHYLFRASSLDDMCFYDFCHCVWLQTKARSKDVKNTFETHLGVLHQHALQDLHPLSQTHELLEHTNDARGEGLHEYVPRVVGMSIPHSTDANKWKLFTLAHFKPFSCTVPLIPLHSSVDAEYASFQFSTRGLAIMKHWESVHECEDERDAERLRRRAQLTSANSDASHSKAVFDDDIDVVPVDPFCKSALEEFKMNQFILLLKQSQWLADGQGIYAPPDEHDLSAGIDANAVSNDQADDPLAECTPQQLKSWLLEIRDQENTIAESRCNALNPGSQTEGVRIVEETAIFDPACHLLHTPHPTEIAAYPQEQLSPTEVIQQIGELFQLNDKQWIVFQIIAEHFVHRYVEKCSDTDLQLTMLMTGPGGMGKTHVVKAVRAVMEYYGHGHIIRFLAPTGSAAALIDGMTIHKGLGIKIKANNKGKGNRRPGDSLQDYSVIVSNQSKRTSLSHIFLFPSTIISAAPSAELKILQREEWRNVGYLLVDETSLLGLQLLAQLDHALRVAKEWPDLWFGGIAIMISGDFYQYAPVGGTALYTAISRYAGQTDDEVQKRLGWLHDPEYVDAVSCLRVRSCTYEDVELFNSRVIKSAANSSGVDMGTPDNIQATAIVATNNLREALNARKAEVSCGANELISSNALDQCTHHDLTLEERHKLLRMNFNNIRASNPLPGVVRLYIGMPVILRGRNISTELGITNGSQGFCALVEFPTSKVKLSGLPPCLFPILPVSWTFTTLLEDDQGNEHKLRITRHQLPIQPAFAVTGHSAQGKTLPSVLVNLHDGGFGAYVAASRARSREGLCITHAVTMDQLNKPLPVDLIREVQRFEAIEHNTYLHCGLRTGEYIQIPDAEAERSLVVAPLCPTLTAPAPRTSTKRRKKNLVDCQGEMDDEDQTRRKKRRINARVQTITHMNTDDDIPSTFDTPDLFRAGCTWDLENWSCAYDCVFMIMYGIYTTEQADWREKWRNLTPLTPVLASAFSSLIHSRDRVCNLFNFHRDAFHDALTHLHPSFQRYGRVGVSASAIFDHLVPYGGCRPYVGMVCFNGCNIWDAMIIHSSDLLPSLCTRSVWLTIAEAVGYNPTAAQISIKTWVDMFLQSIIHRNKAIWSAMTCPDCLNHSLSPVVCLSTLPPVLIFEAVPGATPRLIPSDFFTLPATLSNTTYDLRGVISLEGFHFTARLLGKQPSQRQWSYDGQKNGGIPYPFSLSIDSSTEAEMLYVYGLRT
ncbi:hypothetical protein EDD22DRAFT_960256 [Suillus occidentalis]|nr:hypothetical protein EDD22DRAFT_960256 [Suillus occidentalis]